MTHNNHLEQLYVTNVCGEQRVPVAIFILNCVFTSSLCKIFLTRPIWPVSCLRKTSQIVWISDFCENISWHLWKHCIENRRMNWVLNNDLLYRWSFRNLLAVWYSQKFFSILFNLSSVDPKIVELRRSRLR